MAVTVYRLTDDGFERITDDGAGYRITMALTPRGVYLGERVTDDGLDDRVTDDGQDYRLIDTLPALNDFARITEDREVRGTDDGLAYRVVEVLGYLVPLNIAPPVVGDISTVWIPSTSYADWVMNGALLQSGADLETAMLISLFTDRTAAVDDALPDGSSDRRGWWGDLNETVPIGSLLWLLDRAKLTQAVGPQCESYIRDALQWFLDDGVAEKIEVSTKVSLPSMLAAQIVVFRQDGSRIAQNYAWVWPAPGGR